MRRVAAMATAVALTVSVPVTAVGFETPEDAVRAYLQGVAQGDVERVLETTAVDEMADGYRFEQMADRLGTFLINMPGPVHSPFFADIQRAGWTAELLGQTRMLVYSLLAPDALGDALDLMPLKDVDAAWATDLMAELDQSRLASLVVADIGLPEPELYNSSVNLENAAKFASIFGADEQTERVALSYFEGVPYVVGFTLLRYGDEWKVRRQLSAIGGTPLEGTAQPTTIEEFTELTSD